MRHFQRGRTTYNCSVCKRLTRFTGAQSLGSPLCPQCFDLAGYENDISDGNETLESLRASIDSRLADIAAHGGDTAEWLETFEREGGQ